jgi:hypothetical protein
MRGDVVVCVCREGGAVHLYADPLHPPLSYTQPTIPLSLLLFSYLILSSLPRLRLRRPLLSVCLSAPYLTSPRTYSL